MEREWHGKSEYRKVYKPTQIYINDRINERPERSKYNE